MDNKKSDLVFNEANFFDLVVNHDEENIYKAFGTSLKEVKKIGNSVIGKLEEDSKKSGIGISASQVVEGIWKYPAPLSTRICCLFVTGLAKGAEENIRADNKDKLDKAEIEIIGGSIKNMPKVVKDALRKFLNEDND